MAVSRALRRLLGVLELQQEQARVALELAIAELGRLESARSWALERERAGRRLVAASAGSGELVDRLAGIEEVRTARRLALLLKARIAETQREVALRREAFLAKRVERRQAETLIEEATARGATEAVRRAQQSVDEWFLDRARRSKPTRDAEPGCGDVT